MTLDDLAQREAVARDLWTVHDAQCEVDALFGTCSTCDRLYADYKTAQKATDEGYVAEHKDFIDRPPYFTNRYPEGVL